MRKTRLYILAIILSMMIFCTMVGEGIGQFIDVDKYTIDFKSKIGIKETRVEGEFESKEWDLKAKAVGRISHSDLLGGDLNLKLNLDVAWMSSIFFNLNARFHDLLGDRNSDGYASLRVIIYKLGLWEATFMLSGGWDKAGNLIGPVSFINLVGGTTTSMKLSVDYKQQSLDLRVSIKFSPYEIYGSIVFGDPLAPVFTGTMSGNLTTEAAIPTLKMATSGEYAINETIPSEMVLDVDSQTEKTVGGIIIPVDKFGLLAPYIGLASTTAIGAVATVVYVRRAKRREEKQ
ncbi:hypothetical protein MUP01_05810 [Candidatus Bathyarchaeota archaeon]|nr:hypothetical protein [Candidatus Bathyarchaeota archaeon]